VRRRELFGEYENEHVKQAQKVTAAPQAAAHRCAAPLPDMQLVYGQPIRGAKCGVEVVMLSSGPPLQIGEHELAIDIQKR
jgi:hypothetical protein